MSDPLPTNSAPDALTGVEREAKIEQLLLTGLDHYFDGQYDQAINIWTRALFLDRGHARARAYIERARSALAERQRESEELLQRGLAAFDRGASAEARQLLEAAITRGAPRDEALAVLDRIQRLDPPAERGAGSAPAADAAPVPTAVPGRVPRPWVVAASLALAVVAAFTVLIAVGLLSVQISWGGPEPVPAAGPLAPTGAADELPLPRRGERALVRARRLAQTGRLRDALVSLDQVAMTDEEKAAADRLRADIQRQLIAAAAPATPGAQALGPAGPTP